MLKRIAITLLALIVLSAIVGAYWAHWLYSGLREPYRNYVGPDVFVEIPSGASTDAIGQQLIEAGIVRDWFLFRFAVWRSGRVRGLRAGQYRFDRAMTPEEVVGKLAAGDVYLWPITFPEGLTISDMALLFEQSGFGTAESFRAAAGSPGLIAELDPSARDLEGYLFPDTYALPRHANAAMLVRLMTERFMKAFPESLRREAQSLGLTVRQAVTLASMVEKETGREDERPLVAAVYLNRLRVGMGLQCDPTVIFALRKAGLYNGNLTRENLTFDSPYNTYRYAGLPPGPIAAPGRASLEATVRPADVAYRYFVSRNDGTHVFAATLDAHNRNVRQYQLARSRNRGRR